MEDSSTSHKSTKGRSRSASAKLSKFYNSLRSIKTQWKHVYQKCACRVNHNLTSKFCPNSNSHLKEELWQKCPHEENGGEGEEGTQRVQKNTEDKKDEARENFDDKDENQNKRRKKTTDLSSHLQESINNNNANGFTCPVSPHRKQQQKVVDSGLHEKHEEQIHGETVKCTQDIQFWCVSGEAATDVGVDLSHGFILPTPPPTPKGGDNYRSYQDGDASSYLFKVIPPPYEFQDNYSAGYSTLQPSTSSGAQSEPESQAQAPHQHQHQKSPHNQQRPTSSCSRHSYGYQNLSSCSHFIGMSDIGTRCGHTISESSVNSINRDEEYHLKMPSSIRAYSAYSKLVPSRPPSRSATFTCSRSRSRLSLSGIPYIETCATTTTWIEPDSKSQSPRVQEQIYKDFHRKASAKLLEKLSFTSWRDLPESIVLRGNSEEFSKVMFFPSWSNNVIMNRAPFFAIKEKIINWTKIFQRHDKAMYKKKKMIEEEWRKRNFAKDLWEARHLVGMKKRVLRAEKRISSSSINGDMATRFQFIHWLSESSSDINSIGRFFDVEEKRLVAIKISGDKSPDCILKQVKLKMNAVNEIISLVRLDHVNIVKIFTYFEYRSKVHVVLEACDHSLRCEINCSSKKGVHPKMAHGVIYQIISGLNHCHKMGCLHRHLCPDNILVTVEGVIKISDFSKSIFLSPTSKWAEKESLYPVSIIYASPELLAFDSQYSYSADVWSVGIILVELLRGRVIWNGETPEDQLLFINETLGPLLPQHVPLNMIDDHRSDSKRLRDFFPEAFDDVISFIEKCLEVDPNKRCSCDELLEHAYIKRGSSLHPGHFLYGNTTGSEMLPRMALWELRPHTAPIFNFGHITTFSPQLYDNPATPVHQKVDLPSKNQKKKEEEPENEFSELMDNFNYDDYIDENDKENSLSPHQDNPDDFSKNRKHQQQQGEEETRSTQPSSILRTSKPKKPKANVAFLPEVLKSRNSKNENNNNNSNNNNNQKDSTDIQIKSPHSKNLAVNTARKIEQTSISPRHDLPHLQVHDQGIMREQLYGLAGYKSIWSNLDRISPPKALSQRPRTLQDNALRKGKMTEGRRKQVEPESNSNVSIYNVKPSTSEAGKAEEMFENSLPTNAKSRIQHIIHLLPAANWSTVQIFTTHLTLAAKKSPKTFSAHLESLTTTLLDQITDSKSKVAGPAIRILNNVLETKGDFFEPEAERIIETMLNKLGGPSFIEKEGNEVLKHIVRALKPVKAILALIKFGGNHKTAAARLSTVSLIDETLKKVDLVQACGLPGEQTPPQRRFSIAVFRTVTRALRDANAHSRIAARDIYQHLMNHPGFWYLYQTTVPEDKRVWVNRLLEEMRRSHDYADKSNKTIKVIGRNQPLIYP